VLLGLEQPRILDCDHRLVRECRHQIDFTLREGVHSGAREPHDADRLALTHERHAYHRTTT